MLAFGLAIVWGVSLYSSDSTPARHWWGWFKNDLAHSVFHVIVLPVIVGLVAATLDATLLDRLKPGAKQLAIALLCVLVLLPIPSVYENMHAQPRAPFMLMPTSGQAAAYEFDRCLRRWLDGNDVATLPRACRKGVEAALVSAQKTLSFFSSSDPDKVQAERQRLNREAAFSAYVNSIEPFYASRQRTAAHWLTLLLTYVGTATAAVLLWMLVVAAWTRSPMNILVRQRLVLAFLLFATYVPFGVYSDWYQHYYLFSHLVENETKVAAIGPLLATLIVVLVFVGDPKKLLPWTVGLATVGATLAAVTFPQALVACASAIDKMSVSTFLIVAVPLIAAAAVLGDYYARESSFSATRAAARPAAR